MVLREAGTPGPCLGQRERSSGGGGLAGDPGAALGGAPKAEALRRHPLPERPPWPGRQPPTSIAALVR